MSARIVLLAALSAALSVHSAMAQAPVGPLNPSQQIGAASGGEARAAFQQALGTAPQPLAQAPFVLSPQEQANLDRVLTDWQSMSGTVKTFQAKFTRWDYDAVFGTPGVPSRVAEGELRYAAPDKGYYSHKQNDSKDEKYNETWICTGEAVFQFRYDLKQVREHKLPENLRGKAIADGPMPFVFGVEAQKMKDRYWMRLTTTEAAAKSNQVWIEAYPKHAKDAANYHKVDVILTFVVEGGQLKKLEPYAIKLVQPNAKDYTVYQLRDHQVDNVFDKLNEFLRVFIRPATPLGWTHQVVQESELAGPAAPDGAGNAQVPQPTVPR